MGQFITCEEGGGGEIIERREGGKKTSWRKPMEEHDGDGGVINTYFLHRDPDEQERPKIHREERERMANRGTRGYLYRPWGDHAAPSVGFAGSGAAGGAAAVFSSTTGGASGGAGVSVSTFFSSSVDTTTSLSLLVPSSAGAAGASSVVAATSGSAALGSSAGRKTAAFSNTKKTGPVTRAGPNLVEASLTALAPGNSADYNVHHRKTLTGR